MSRKILAVIPARGGSKGLVGKNIIDLAGKPLIAWSIEASKASKYISKTIVSSDDDKILSTAKGYGASILKRADELSCDNSKSEDVVVDALKKIQEDYEYVVLLQPTSPLRDAQDIDAAFEMFFASDASALISVYEIDKKILKAFTLDVQGHMKGIANNNYPFMPRQELPNTYMSNGAIYIIDTQEFLKNKSFHTDKTIPFVMSEIKSLDIDKQEDLDKVKVYMK